MLVHQAPVFSLLARYIAYINVPSLILEQDCQTYFALTYDRGMRICDEGILPACLQSHHLFQPSCALRVPNRTRADNKMASTDAWTNSPFKAIFQSSKCKVDRPGGT